MALFDRKITMSTCEGRSCWVHGRRAIFHRWSDSARPVNPYGKNDPSDERLQKWSVHGIVEYEDGTVEREWPSAIRFADSLERFEGLAWEEMEARRDAMDGRQTRKACGNCAHQAEHAYICPEVIYCEDCTAKCWCRDCRDFSKWEPAEGTV